MTGLRAAMAAEWAKASSLRSTAASLVCTVVVGVGLSIAGGLSWRSWLPTAAAADRAEFDPVFAGLYSVTIGQIALVTFGVLLVTGEYAHGTIRTSLVAVPRRHLFFLSKLLVGALLALAVSATTAFGAFLAGQAALGPYGTSLGADGALRATLGASVSMTSMAVLAMGVAFLLRSAALTLGILLPLLFLGSQGLANLPKVGAVVRYFPDQAGTALMQSASGDNFLLGRSLDPKVGLLVVLAWTAAAVAAGHRRLVRADA